MLNSVNDFIMRQMGTAWLGSRPAADPIYFLSQRDIKRIKFRFNLPQILYLNIYFINIKQI